MPAAAKLTGSVVITFSGAGSYYYWNPLLEPVSEGGGRFLYAAMINLCDRRSLCGNDHGAGPRW
jgi:hypothetical protein